MSNEKQRNEGFSCVVQKVKFNGDLNHAKEQCKKINKKVAKMVRYTPFVTTKNMQRESIKIHFGYRTRFSDEDLVNLLQDYKEKTKVAGEKLVLYSKRPMKNNVHEQMLFANMSKWMGKYTAVKMFLGDGDTDDSDLNLENKENQNNKSTDNKVKNESYDKFEYDDEYEDDCEDEFYQKYGCYEDEYYEDLETDIWIAGATGQIDNGEFLEDNQIDMLEKIKARDRDEYFDFIKKVVSESDGNYYGKLKSSLNDLINAEKENEDCNTELDEADNDYGM